eukprot:TRINITY_DN8249_c0_g1_i1.p1 TRINITY_DN8249_c0_g1~~TRINITY_DN8249_c0_g1_i1.p1  ORF type:complete len:265 (-),score=58.95 TRINITY_DN8249_c0_g1_i1:22-816(-)
MPRPAYLLLLCFFVSMCIGTHGYWHPTPGVTWDYQASGNIDAAVPVQAYAVPLFETTAESIQAAQAAGKKVICMFSAGVYEDWRPDAGMYPPSILGEAVDAVDTHRRYVNIRATHVSGFSDILSARFELALQKGCDAVVPDDTDLYLRRTGFDIETGNQLKFNKWLALQAHSRDITIGLMNSFDLAEDLCATYDFAVAEECNVYDECKFLAGFVAQNKAVLAVSYVENGEQSSASVVCPQALQLKFDWIMKSTTLAAQPLSQCS